MGINFKDDLYDDCGYRIRCMDSLRKQLEADYDELNSSLKKLKNNTNDISKIDEAFEKISWIKQGLKMFERLEMKNIEGVLCNGLENIERDMMVNEAKLKILRLTVLHGNNRKWI